MMVVLTHIAEAFHLFPWMQWGLKQSAGHYLDLGCAVLGLVLFPGGYLLGALTREPPTGADCGIARGPARCDPGSSQIGRLKRSLTALPGELQRETGCGNG